jgi:hypothetical protein
MQSLEPVVEDEENEKDYDDDIEGNLVFLYLFPFLF